MDMNWVKKYWWLLVIIGFIIGFFLGNIIPAIFGFFNSIFFSSDLVSLFNIGFGIGLSTSISNFFCFSSFDWTGFLIGIISAVTELKVFNIENIAINNEIFLNIIFMNR